MGQLQSNLEWLFWGRHDPLYAVATRPGKQAGGPTPWTADEFLETGRLYFADVYRHWTVAVLAARLLLCAALFSPPARRTFCAQGASSCVSVDGN